MLLVPATRGMSSPGAHIRCGATDSVRKWHVMQPQIRPVSVTTATQRARGSAAPSSVAVPCHSHPVRSSHGHAFLYALRDRSGTHRCDCVVLRMNPHWRQHTFPAERRRAGCGCLRLPD